MFNYKTKVSYSRIDKDGCLSVCNTVDAMQDGCMFHTSTVGHSATLLLKKNRAWMVSSWYVIFIRRPELDEVISVDAWIYNMSRLFSSWNYKISSDNGELLAYADAQWFYADPTTGKPARIDDDERNAYNIEPQLDMPKKSRRITYPDSMNYRYAIEVSPNYLDTNLHVNNGQYIRIATNVLPYDMNVKELRAEYCKAAKYGDTLHIYTKDEGDYYYVLFKNNEAEIFFVCEFKI